MIHFDFHSPSLSVCLPLGFPAFFLFLPLSSWLLHFVPQFAFLSSVASFVFCHLFSHELICLHSAGTSCMLISCYSLLGTQDGNCMVESTFLSHLSSIL